MVDSKPANEGRHLFPRLANVDASVLAIEDYSDIFHPPIRLRGKICTCTRERQRLSGTKSKCFVSCENNIAGNSYNSPTSECRVSARYATSGGGSPRKGNNGGRETMGWGHGVVEKRMYKSEANNNMSCKTHLEQHEEGSRS